MYVCVHVNNFSGDNDINKGFTIEVEEPVINEE